MLIVKMLWHMLKYKQYIPVIITNSDIETVNQENGLVRFNIEYTLAHKVQTQRN